LFFQKKIESSSDDVDFSKSEFIGAPELDSKSVQSIILWPSSREIRLLLDTEWLDSGGHTFYPSVHVAWCAWNDDTTFTWQYFSIDEFIIRGDTIVIHTQELAVLDYQMNGVNFSFRARLSSAGVQTDWVRLPESIRLYDDKRRGVPQMPRSLRLIRP